MYTKDINKNAEGINAYAFSSGKKLCLCILVQVSYRDSAWGFAPVRHFAHDKFPYHNSALP